MKKTEKRTAERGREDGIAVPKYDLGAMDKARKRAEDSPVHRREVNGWR